MTTDPLPSITREWQAGTPAPGWRAHLAPEFSKPYMRGLVRFLDEERRQARIFPEPRHIFRAYTLTDYPEVRVVILGQDPYPTPGHANGLAFSVWENIGIPRSLQNIFREIHDDLGTPPPPNGSLDRWARQGVFLLNTSLTVRAGQPNSHRGRGWEEFTSRTIAALSDRADPIVFLLWGRNARDHKGLVDTSRHCVLEAPHPSPMSADRGFFGCRHFSRTNQFLVDHGFPAIEW